MKRIKRAVTVFVIFIMFICLTSSAWGADELMKNYTLTVIVNGTETQVRAYDASYANNTFISLSDLSVALKNTPASFSFEKLNDNAGDYYVIKTSSQPKTTSVGAATGYKLWLQAVRNRLYVNGEERKRYTVANDGDLYMSITDIMLEFDITARYVSTDCLQFFTDEPFVPDVYELKKEGYFDSYNSVLVGDADTGRVIFAINRYTPVPIASTTKLMTWLLMAEAVDNGDLSYSDSFTVTSTVSALSGSLDGMIPMEVGKVVPLTELVDAMMLASSNESAMAVAEMISGTEEEFVRLMNDRAVELRLTTASFNNSNGLPTYSENSVISKQQNRMSAGDMFKLVRYILDNHPEITDITSKKLAQMPAMNYASANSNPLVYNVDGVNGLKTGSTNKAGHCLITSMPMEHEGEVHNIIVMEFGAESAIERGHVSEILLRWAENYYAENGFSNQKIR